VSSPAAAIRLLLVARGLRAIADGFVSVLLPVYLLRLGYSPFVVGAIAFLTLVGSASVTLTIGLWAGRFPTRRLLLAMATLMIATGALFAAAPPFWLLLLSPSSARSIPRSAMSAPFARSSRRGLPISRRRTPAPRSTPATA
jgi:MFS family permease